MNFVLIRIINSKTISANSKLVQSDDLVIALFKLDYLYILIEINSNYL